MEIALPVIIITLVLAVICWILIRRADNHMEELKRQAEELKGQNAKLTHENTLLHTENAREKAEKNALQQQLKLEREQSEREEMKRQELFNTQLKLAQEQMKTQFDKELKEKTDSFKQTNQEQMVQIVAPLMKELETLSTLVTTSKEANARQTTALEASIRAVFEHDKERDKTTQSLAAALKNRGKVQGDWGELVLENILRDSGLREGEEYRKQVNVKGEEGNNERPDIVVYGADGSCIIVDSKVSLTAYTDYVGAETDDERASAIKANYDSIWKHVCELSDKQYQKKVDKAMPMVLMFVPNEGSYILAMNKDPQLGAKAYKKNVLIINPTNLMVVLRLMFLTWQNTRQEKNNREILKAASKIYEKYSVFANSYVKLGSHLNTLSKTYEDGVKQLTEGKGNLSKQLQDLLKYGITTTKQIPDKLQSIDYDEESEDTE